MVPKKSIFLKANRRAVVLGGSVAGMLAAKVLSEFFDEVLVIEKDQYPDKKEFRKGVPQSRFGHIILSSGLDHLSDLFPGFLDQFKSHGVEPFDLGQGFRFYLLEGWGIPGLYRLPFLPASRELIDYVLRSEVQKISNVHIQDQTEITGIEIDRQTGLISAVQTGEGSLGCDVLVDCSGRRSALPGWLSKRGIVLPRETIIDPHTGYASRIYQAPARLPAWRALAIGPRPPATKRIGTILPIEGNRWMVTLAGANQDYPPSDESGFLKFAQGLQKPDLRDALRGATALGPIYIYRNLKNRIRHYEEMEKLPENLAVLGDAVCSFNPVYGQGITVAARGAQLLREQLWTQYQLPLERRLGLGFQKNLAKELKWPWLLATSEDFRYEGTDGPHPGRWIRAVQLYLDFLLRKSTSDPTVAKTLYSVMSLKNEPRDLFTPKVLWAALRSEFRGGVKEKGLHGSEAPYSEGLL